MTRRLLTRLAVAAGCLAPAGTMVFGQVPGNTPGARPGTPPRMMWVRPGSPPAGRPATVTAPRQPALPAEQPATPQAAVNEEVTWVRPGGPPVVVEARPEKAAPPVVQVEARTEPMPSSVPIPPPTPATLPPTLPAPAVPPDGWHRVGSSRDLPPPTVEMPPPSPQTIGSPVTEGGQATEKKEESKPPTWHGLKHPVQAFPPPGSSPIAPTDPGYYSLRDQLHGNFREKPPRWPYPRGGPIGPSFSEIDFSYLDAIPFAERDWAERLHRIPLGERWLFSTGGEFRTRYNYETNTRLLGINDTYQLYRNRLYTDVWFEDYFRVYTEFYYGDVVWQDTAPYARDVNRGDIQQLFFDLKLCEIDSNPLYLRGGRQEMLFGSQRLISTNDWGNSRPRFDGLKLHYHSEKLDADAFVVRPTRALFGKLDPWDVNQTFSGAWFTFKPKKGTLVDLYYLNLENDNPVRGQFTTGSSNTSTFGGRFYGRHDSGLLHDFEGMFQFGHRADQTILAQAFHAYAGWYFKDCWATPTIWVGYDYASGDPDPNNTGQYRTFNQLFQFGHYYYGFIDITGGQNIRNWNIQAYAYPTNWIQTGIQYHVFRLDSNKDALYNASGQAIRQDRTGRAGNDVGSEIDVLVNFHLTDRQDVFLNYCHFFPGPFIKATGPGFGLDYVYAQYSLRW